LAEKEAAHRENYALPLARGHNIDTLASRHYDLRTFLILVILPWSMVMAKARRLQLIKRIEKARKSRLVCYVTSTRQNFESAMAMDATRKIFEHLQEVKGEKIDLFLVSNGGDGIVPWRLVTLIREFTNDFSVLIPWRAFSAATLTALGANQIVMHPMGMLGPTDPTVTTPFNPRDPSDPANKVLGISVEAVSAYIDLVKQDVGIQHEDELIQAFNILAQHVHPLALGSVKRFISQSHMMATKLLSLHMNRKDQAHKISEIVDSLTSKLFYHGHPINRIEARDEIEIPTINFPPSNVETAMWELFLEYESEMSLDSPFDPAMEFLGEFPAIKPTETKVTGPKTARVAFIESVHHTDNFVAQYTLSGTMQPDGSTRVMTIYGKRKWEQM